MAKIKMLWNILLLNIMYTVMGVITAIMCSIKKGVVYTNVHFSDGVALSNEHLIYGFSLKGTPLSLESSQGKIAIVHGSKDGNFSTNGIVINHEQMAMLFKEGEYTLISCYNGARDNFEYCSRRFIKSEGTDKMYPVFLMAGYGNLLIYSDYLVEIYVKIMTKFSFK